MPPCRSSRPCRNLSDQPPILLQTFDPLLHWAQEHMGWKLHPCDSIFGTTQDSATVEAAHRYMKGGWQVVARSPAQPAGCCPMDSSKVFSCAHSSRRLRNSHTVAVLACYHGMVAASASYPPTRHPARS
jgi:hypothetical protein